MEGRDLARSASSVIRLALSSCSNRLERSAASKSPCRGLDDFCGGWSLRSAMIARAEVWGACCDDLGMTREGMEEVSRTMSPGLVLID